MRKIYPAFFLALPFLADAQYFKYAMVEWFTNTYCPICSSRNPALHNVYNQYADQLHRISIHPSVPYPQCPLYNYNKEDNSARQTYYNVGGTPTLFINGIRSSSSASIFEDDVKKQLNQTSPVAVEVDEAIGSSPDITITIKAAGEVPAGNYKLFVALLEETVDLQAQNGETFHPDVLRDFISSNTGDDFTMPASGQSTVVNYSYDLPNGVSDEKAYVIAYVQDVTSKAVLNSGTRFDVISTTLSETAVETQLKAFPNPVSDRVNISVNADYKIHHLDLFNHTGQKVKSVSLDYPENQAVIPTNDLPPGAYLVRVSMGSKKAMIRFIKE
jgi:hypothetical protein